MIWIMSYVYVYDTDWLLRGSIKFWNFTFSFLSINEFNLVELAQQFQRCWPVLPSQKVVFIVASFWSHSDTNRLLPKHHINGWKCNSFYILDERNVCCVEHKDIQTKNACIYYIHIRTQQKYRNKEDVPRLFAEFKITCKRKGDAREPQKRCTSVCVYG